jgi:hypothetical protein
VNLVAALLERVTGKLEPESYAIRISRAHIADDGLPTIHSVAESGGPNDVSHQSAGLSDSAAGPSKVTN